MNEVQLLTIITAIIRSHDPLERTEKALQEAKDIIKYVQNDEAATYRG
jgi:hypothetical protein